MKSFRHLLVMFVITIYSYNAESVSAKTIVRKEHSPLLPSSFDYRELHRNSIDREDVEPSEVTSNLRHGGASVKPISSLHDDYTREEFENNEDIAMLKRDFDKLNNHDGNNELDDNDFDGRIDLHYNQDDKLLSDFDEDGDNNIDDDDDYYYDKSKINREQDWDLAKREKRLNMKEQAVDMLAHRMDDFHRLEKVHHIKELQHRIGELVHHQVGVDSKRANRHMVQDSGHNDIPMNRYTDYSHTIWKLIN